MKKIFFVALLAFIGCKKDDDTNPKRMAAETVEGVFKISASSNYSGAGGNQIEYSIGGGDTAIVGFKNGVVIDSTILSGQTFYVKCSSLDYTQQLFLDVTFNGQMIKSGKCTRNQSTPDNCSIILSGTIQ